MEDFEGEEVIEEIEVEDTQKYEDWRAKPQRAKRSRAKVSTEWTEAQINKLICCVEAEPCLWNAAEKSYSNNIKRQAAWNSITDQLENKFTCAELNGKWSNLRIQYRSCHAKKPKSGSGADAVVKWKYYTAMSFVGAAEESQRENTISNMDESSQCNLILFRVDALH